MAGPRKGGQLVVNKNKIDSYMRRDSSSSQGAKTAQRMPDSIIEQNGTPKSVISFHLVDENVEDEVELLTNNEESENLGV